MTGIAPLTWMAVAAWIGSTWGAGVPIALALAVAGTGLSRRSAWVTALGLLLLCSSLAARSADGLAPTSRTEHRGEVTLVSDPRFFGPSLRVDLRIGDERIEAWARGRDAAALTRRLSGERVVIAGTIRPPPADTPWLARRHVVGRMTVTAVGAWRPGDPASRAANGLRRTLVAGTQTMDRDRRSLYAGLLLGDQRDQGPVVSDAFIGSGLTHLLAVSGQNVAFVMALVGPVLCRLRLGGRFAATIAVLAFFALLTRFEPSVLRATTMAGFGALAVTLGREADSRRLLALAVIALLMVDPMIAGHLAFQLSVAASAGILLWSNPLADALPGPRPLTTAVAVTVAAQAAVAPLLIPTFGGMPVSSLLANVLAAPATGPVVVWGIPAGIVAGILGGRAAELIHLPTGVLVGWIGSVAEVCAMLPLGEVRTVHLAVALGGAALVRLGRAQAWRPAVACGVVVLAGAFIHPAVALMAGSPMSTDIDAATRLHVLAGASVLELDIGSRPDVVLEALRRAGVGRVDVVVARHGGRDVAEVVAALRQRAVPRLVLAPAGHRVPGGSVGVAGSTITVGGLEIRVGSNEPRLQVEVRPAAGARPPPV